MAEAAASVPAWYAAKPVASVDDLGSGGEWVEYDVTPEEVDAFRALLGGGEGEVPQGMLAVVARLAYLAGHRSPPGGVLARLEWRSFHEPPADGRLMARSEVVEDEWRRGRRRVQVDVDLADREAGAVARLTWHLVWPEATP